MGICYGLLLIVSIDDAPSDIEAAAPSSNPSKVDKGKGKGGTKEEGAGGGKVAAVQPKGLAIYLEVLKNPAMWGLAMCYFCIAVVREFLSAWGPRFIEDVYGARFPTETYTRGCHWIPRMFA
jgi:sugar phosphate permease